MWFVSSAQPEWRAQAARKREKDAGHPEGGCLKLHVETGLLPVVFTV